MMCAPLHIALDQPSLFEHLDMLRDAVEREIKVACNLQDSGALFCQLRQDGSTNRVR